MRLAQIISPEMSQRVTDPIRGAAQAVLMEDDREARSLYHHASLLHRAGFPVLAMGKLQEAEDLVGCIFRRERKVLVEAARREMEEEA